MKTKAGIDSLITITLLGLLASLGGCASLKSIFAISTSSDRLPPIQNPFGDISNLQAKENIVLRTKKGDRSVEIEVPQSTGSTTDWVVPVSPAFRELASSDSGTGTADGLIEGRYDNRAPSLTDREITKTFPGAIPEESKSRKEIENALGVVSSEEDTPARDKSYLAALDRVKQLYKGARYEAALLDLDELIRAYPTDPKLYTMRGTLLDRLGQTDLAMRSWTQALRFDPANDTLKTFIERKQATKKSSSLSTEKAKEGGT